MFICPQPGAVDSNMYFQTVFEQAHSNCACNIFIICRVSGFQMSFLIYFNVTVACAGGKDEQKLIRKRN